MKTWAVTILSLLITLTAIGLNADAVDNFELRGQVADLGVDQFTWDTSNFPGLYFDLDKNLGTEAITIRLSELTEGSAVLSDTEDANGNLGITYTTQAQLKNFDFKPWGSYYIAGFLGEPCLVAYSDQKTAEMRDAGETGSPYFYDMSKSRNIMDSGQLSQVLIDNDYEQTITTTTPLHLKEGYDLVIKSINPKDNAVYLELRKDNHSVDNKLITPSIVNAKISDKTYYYKSDLGKAKGIVTIAVHFKNAFIGSDFGIATIDGIFQISSKPVSIAPDQQYDIMSIRNFDPNAMTIVMDNKDHRLMISKGIDEVLMQNILIRTADQAIIDSSLPLRYYIYKKLIEPGKYSIRSEVADLGTDSHTFTPINFAGFYYDLNKNLGNEQITFTLSDIGPGTAKLSDQSDSKGIRGVVYTTAAQVKHFNFHVWGEYWLIGFLGESYFAGYSDTPTPDMIDLNQYVPFLYDRSKNRNLMAKELLSKVLIDDNKEQVMKKDGSLRLSEGYELALKGVDEKGRIFIELFKNGHSIDTKVVQPSIDNAVMADQTYYYKADLGGAKEIITIAVHFKNSYRDEDQAYATVDAIWQISDEPISINGGKKYDKMSIRTVDTKSMTITMDNKDNQIILSKNKDTVLMQDINIKTANQDNIDSSTPLSYYLYKSVDIGASENYSTPSSNETDASNNLAKIDRQACSWTGSWKTDFGSMELQQSGIEVTGSYTHDLGRFEGIALGNKLKGTWSEAPTYSSSQDSGNAELMLSDDCQSFSGNWKSGSSVEWEGEWTGQRSIQSTGSSTALPTGPSIISSTSPSTGLSSGQSKPKPLEGNSIAQEAIPLADLAQSKPAIISFPNKTLSKVITSAGGGTVQDEGMSLTVLPGAVSDDTDVVVKRLTGEFPPGTLGDAEAAVISKVYDFGPDGIKLKAPVQVTISYDPEQLPDGTDDSNIMPAYFNGQKWITFEGSVDRDKKEVSFRAQEFPGSLITIVGGLIIVLTAGYAVYTEVPRKIGAIIWDPIIKGTAHKYVTPKDDSVVDHASRARLTSEDDKDSISLKEHAKIASWLEKHKVAPFGFSDSSGKIMVLNGRYTSNTEFMKTPNEYLTKYNKIGDCVDVADALVSIFLANGYPAKGVSGYTKGGGPHAWGEVLIGDKVYIIDENGQIELKESFMKKGVVVYPKPSDPRYRMWDDKKTEPYNENWYKSYLKASKSPGGSSASGSSASGTFPAEPFNGMQIDYSVSGASIINSTDSEGFATARTLQGTLGSGELRVSGTARMGGGYSADLAVKVWAGDKEDNSSANIPTGYPGFNEQTFDIAVPIPPGVTSGGFSIDMTGYYNAGDRGLSVSGDFASRTG